MAAPLVRRFGEEPGLTEIKAAPAYPVASFSSQSHGESWIRLSTRSSAFWSNILPSAISLPRHQEALLDRRFGDATQLLEEYGERLREHIALEERYLLPKCAALDSARWPPQVYRAEHRRIEQLLARTDERLRREGHRGITAAVLISILDEERTLKRLVEHHHEREETALFSEVRTVVGNAA